MYFVEGMDLCLVGIVEILVGGMYMDSMFFEFVLFLKIVVYFYCFCMEVGVVGVVIRYFIVFVEDFIFFKFYY